MKKLAVFTFVALVLFFSGWNQEVKAYESSTPHNEATEKAGMVNVYQCPMDKYASKTIEKCPLCGMKMQEKKMTATDAQGALQSSIDASPSSQANAEHIHDHTSLQGGQVGMSGDFHIEFAARRDGEYKLYVTDFLRKQVDISKGSGTLVINSDGQEPEELALAVDSILQEFFVAQGKPRSEGDAIVASAKITIPGQEPIFIEFVEQIGTSGNEKDGHEGHRH